MNGRNMDLRPDSVRRRVESAREKTHLRNMSVVAAVLLTVAWSTGAWRLSDARAEHALATPQGGGDHPRRARAGSNSTPVRRSRSSTLGMAAMFDPVRCVLDRGFDRQRPSGIGNDRANRSRCRCPVIGDRFEAHDPGRSKPAARRITAEIEGFTASDDDVALFVEALRRRPLTQRGPSGDDSSSDHRRRDRPGVPNRI